MPAGGEKNTGAVKRDGGGGGGCWGEAHQRAQGSGSWVGLQDPLGTGEKEFQSTQHFHQGRRR